VVRVERFDPGQGVIHLIKMRLTDVPAFLVSALCMLAQADPLNVMGILRHQPVRPLEPLGVDRTMQRTKSQRNRYSLLASMIRYRPKLSMHLLIAPFFALCAGVSSAHAQVTPAHGSVWEFYGSGGWLIPTGTQKESIKGADMTALIVSYVPRPGFGVTGTFGWARSHALHYPGDPKLDVFTADMAMEARSSRFQLSPAWRVAPFAAIGVGARGYNIPSSNAKPTYNPSAYASLGSELAWRDLRIRFELRDYVSRFKSSTGDGKASLRNDLAILIGLRFAKD